MNSRLPLAAVARPSTGRRSRNGDSTTTMASALTDQVRRDIIQGRLMPGTKLKLRELAAAYGVGVIPLREALSRLTNSGFLDFADQKGFTIRPVSEKELKDLTRTRLVVEKEALRDAIAHADIAWEERIVAAHHRMSRLPIGLPHDPTVLNPEWEAAHDDFHLQLISNCESEWLKRFVHTLREQTARYRHMSVRSERTATRDVTGEHLGLMSAVLESRADDACRLLDEHLNLSSNIAISEAGISGRPS